VHSRLKTISSLGLQRFGPTLKRLCLRQNHIKTLDPEVMKALVNLSELDMYDNKIKDVGDALDSLVDITYVVHLYMWSAVGWCLSYLGSFRTLDLSFNLLRAIPAGLRHLQKLKTVYFVQDRISIISGLDSLGATLTSLELGGNKIRVRRGQLCPMNSLISRPFRKENRRSRCARESRRVVARKEQDHKT